MFSLLKQAAQQVFGLLWLVFSSIVVACVMLLARAVFAVLPSEGQEQESVTTPAPSTAGSAGPSIPPQEVTKPQAQPAMSATRPQVMPAPVVEGPSEGSSSELSLPAQPPKRAVRQAQAASTTRSTSWSGQRWGRPAAMVADVHRPDGPPVRVPLQSAPLATASEKDATPTDNNIEPALTQASINQPPVATASVVSMADQQSADHVVRPLADGEPSTPLEKPAALPALHHVQGVSRAEEADSTGTEVPSPAYTSSEFLHPSDWSMAKPPALHPIEDVSRAESSAFDTALSLTAARRQGIRGLAHPAVRTSTKQQVTIPRDPVYKSGVSKPRGRFLRHAKARVEEETSSSECQDTPPPVALPTVTSELQPQPDQPVAAPSAVVEPPFEEVDFDDLMAALNAEFGSSTVEEGAVGQEVTMEDTSPQEPQQGAKETVHEVMGEASPQKPQQKSMEKFDEDMSDVQEGSHDAEEMAGLTESLGFDPLDSIMADEPEVVTAPVSASTSAEVDMADAPPQPAEQQKAVQVTGLPQPAPTSSLGVAPITSAKTGLAAQQALPQVPATRPTGMAAQQPLPQAPVSRPTGMAAQRPLPQGPIQLPKPAPRSQLHLPRIANAQIGIAAQRPRPEVPTQRPAQAGAATPPNARGADSASQSASIIAEQLRASFAQAPARSGGVQLLSSFLPPEGAVGRTLDQGQGRSVRQIAQPSRPSGVPRNRPQGPGSFSMLPPEQPVSVPQQPAYRPVMPAAISARLESGSTLQTAMSPASARLDASGSRGQTSRPAAGPGPSRLSNMQSASDPAVEEDLSAPHVPSTVSSPASTSTAGRTDRPRHSWNEGVDMTSSGRSDSFLNRYDIGRGLR